jgi:hypothetical protein
MRFLSRRPAKRAVSFIPLLLALVLLLALAQTAAAGPPQPTMDLQQLGAALQSGPMDGYLLTTMSGSTPEQIPVTVKSLIDYSWGKLIFFAATGPQIDSIGGIAAGMSGSPIFVDDNGVDKLVGALSYGDIFTLGGLGLATPIEYMTAIENAYPVGALASLETPRAPKAGTYKLHEPVKTADGVVRSVVVARSAQAGAKVAAASGQSVMVPLGIIEIGGARPGSKAFDRAAAKFAKTGMLVKAASGSGAWAGAPTPDLEAGSPCAILFSQGDVWVGAAGTVTYVDGGAALFFGHPFMQLGPIDAVLTGGDVQGVWASSIEPYKEIAPRDVKGTCVQDRNWGVEAHLGQAPDLFPVTTTVNSTGGALLKHDDSFMSEWLATSDQYPTLAGDIVDNVAYEALDQMAYPGSAETTTTVVVSDSTGSYTVTRHNLWTSSFDVSSQSGRDASSALMTLVANPDGVLHPRIDSVAVEVAVSTTQRSARIADVTLPDGLKIGDNMVRIDYYRYGSPDLQTLETTLTIPRGTQLYGRLTVTPASWDQWGGGWCCCCGCSGPGGSTGGSGAPQTLADVVDALNSQPTNGDLLVSYQPRGSSPDGSSQGPATIDVTVPTDYVFNSYFSATTAHVQLRVHPATVTYGGTALAEGVVDGATQDVDVAIYRLDAGAASPKHVATVKAVAKHGTATFFAVVPGLRKNATLIATCGPVDGSLPGGATASVKVLAKVWLTGTSKLAVHVRPGDASGTAKLQRKTGGGWAAFRTVKITNGEGATNLPSGTFTLRVKFSGSDLCAPATSRSFTITVK